MIFCGVQRLYEHYGRWPLNWLAPAAPFTIPFKRRRPMIEAIYLLGLAYVSGQGAEHCAEANLEWPSMALSIVTIVCYCASVWYFSAHLFL